MSTYVVPQVLVFQEFTLVPSASVEPLRATIVGPNYQLVKTAAEGELGEYNPNLETSYAWPNREAGAVVDQDWTRVFIDDAILQYFYNAASVGDTIKATYCEDLDLMSNSTIKNAIRASATNWKTNGAYTRAAALLERDVQVGDSIKIEATVGGSTETLWSYVAGFISDKIAGVVGNAVQDPNNASAEADASSSINAAAVWSKVGFASNSVDIDAAATPPNVPEQGYIDGVEADEYTFDVLQGGDYDEAVIRVTSASGTDDVAEMTLSDWGVASSFGNKNLSVTFDRTDPSDVFEVGMQWELTATFGAVDVDPVSSGAYTGPSDTTYVIEVTTGGKFGGSEGNPAIMVTTTTGIDSSGPHTISALDTEISIGSYGTKIEFISSLGEGQGLYKGDKYYIPVQAPAAGPVRTLVLGHSLTDVLLGLDDDGNCDTPPSLSVTLYIKKDIEVTEARTGFAPVVNWETSATEITLADGILSYDASWVNSSGTMLPLPVKGGTAWAYYRALKQLSSGAVGTVDSVSEAAALTGTADSDNPLSMGLYMALLNANGTDVKYASVATDDLAGYTGALEKLSQRDDVYNIVPLTFDTAIQAAVAAHVEDMSTSDTGRWRRAIFCSEVLDETAIVDSSDNSGNAVLATITDDPITSGTQYTLVDITSNISLVDLGVVAGDILRAKYTVDGFGNTSYSEYTVDAVLAEDSLRLVSGPLSPVSVAAKIEIWRNLSATQHAEAIAAKSAGFASRRVTNIWPDYFEASSESLEGYYLACAYAGLRSGVVPQRSLTNTALSGVTSVEKTTEDFTDSQLNTIAESGTCIITQSPAGEVYVRHALTTDMTDINTKEESITVNLDSISYFMLEQIEPFIGVSNLIDGTINQIRVELEDAMEFLRNNSNIPTVGGQLVDGSITSITRHPTLSDRLVVILSLDLPEPLNNVELHLVV